MERPLHGRLILVAEDEALIALDLKETLEDEEGAHVYLASTFREALNTVDHPKLCAAILDHSFREGDSSEVCARLKKRDIPFVIYSGHGHVSGACQAGVLVRKPADISEVVAAIKALLDPPSTPMA